ncbi:TPA: hypothetical protein I7680_06360 [Vibrio vulnificus]|uniref:hypothetical protein n=1 Tax=Vibrio vulnificus TaxID=672 RepID=UPI00102B3051|nr:hypothetical protein [Vibrio vulnificus]RZR38679.1 hypothetical protein D8T58_23835 [Vibrio vulnificus]HAS8171100.1 hypothetical protein [Vibrio vulnificus]HAS8445210.1 hypothetical protein [Vibrio vulnificus]HAS8454665.1 hypothetical protein [Vibrio vulnificus]
MARSKVGNLIERDLAATPSVKGKKKNIIHYVQQYESKKISLKPLDHYHCNEANPLVTCLDRRVITDKLKDVIRDDFEMDRISNGRQLFFLLRSYLSNADRLDLPPFSEEAWKAYFGANGYLWKLVDYGKRLYTHTFMYDHNQPIGIAEKTAAGKKRLLIRMFSRINLPVFDWDMGLKEFSVSGAVKRLKEPYSSNEQEVALKRLHDKFFLLAPLLIAERNLASGGRRSTIFEKASALLLANKKQMDVELGFLEEMEFHQVFNFTMTIAYHLFCHYTAFNDSVVTSVRRPIEFVTEKREGKVSQYAQIKGYKSRAYKEVYALVIGDASNLEEVSARVDKRTGASFLNMLLELSQAYNAEQHGLLLFEMARDGSLSGLKTDLELDFISRKLELFADKRLGLAERLSENIQSLFYAHYVESVKTIIDEQGIRRVSKERKYYRFNSNQFSQLIPNLSLAFFQCFSPQTLRYAQLPLYYSDVDDKGKVTVTCVSKFVDSAGENNNGIITFYADERFVPVMKKLEEWASRRNPVYRKRAKGNQYTLSSEEPEFNYELTTRTPYLFPQGRIGETRPYNEYPVTATMLRELGITPSHFFNTLNSSRFRLTVADNEYRYGSVVSAMATLQNSKRVFEKHYANGHKGQNNEIIAQALDVIEQIIKGVELEEAKEKVRDNWKIEVLAFDEYKRRGKPTNPNGTCCDGIPQFEGKEDVLAQSKATDLGVTNQSDKTHCYQYDKCHECMNAKLVDDPKQVYKLLSFIESLIDAADRYPENEELERRIASFEELVSMNISESVLEQAEEMLGENGRYFMFE